MKNFSLLFMLFVLPLAHAHAMSWSDLSRVLFKEPKRFASSDEENFQRGSAQETRPDITVPPPPTAQAGNDSAMVNNPADPQSTLLTQQKFEDLIGGLEKIASINHEPNLAPGTDILPTQAYRPADSAQKVKWVPPPPGFMTADTFNYLIYREEEPVTSKLKTVLDTIHGNLMLDLSPFTVVLKPNKILVMLFDNRNSYMDYTKRPSWSGASSDLRSDSMYVIEETGFYPLTVHELTHLYFDGFFLPTISPLWLSEGMAVYMQIYASQQKPSWITQSLQRIVLRGEIIPFEEMMSTDTLQNYATDEAELWYTQAYSVVDYLLNRRTRDEFYRFCTELKNKTPVYQALYRAYGMPFNKVSALQNAWLHDLQKTYQEQVANPQPAPPSVAQKTAAAPKQPAPQSAPKAAPKQTAPKSASKSSSKPPQQTQINKLQMVPQDQLPGGGF